MSLRTRLLLSYLLVIVTCLVVIILALLLLLRNDPLQKRLEIGQLTVEAGVVNRFVRNQLQNGVSAEQLIRRLQASSAVGDTRIMLIDVASGQVAADTDGQLVGQNLFALGKPQRTGNLYTGEFNSGGAHWLYSSRLAANGKDGSEVIAATIFDNSPSFNDPIFSELMRPIVIAALLALAVSVVLAVIVTRSVERPLRHVARASQKIAAGDYNQHIPLEGPSEVQEMAGSFNQMTQKVRDTQQSQRDLLANVTHELKTPLTSIQGFAQAIKDGVTNEPDSLRRTGSIIYDEALRMGRLVSNLLDLARIESGQIVMRREPVKLDLIVLSAVERMALRAQQSQISLQTEMPPSLPAIVGDGDRLAQVFSNLIDNALKHTPPGGTVTVSARSLSGSSVVKRGKSWPGGIEVIVADTGSGIPPEDLTRIFERFYQVDKSRVRSSAPSLGLGLAIVKEIVTAHGGSIRAESTVGQGARFSVTLPLERGAKTG